MNSRKKIMILVIAIVTMLSFNYNIYADDSDECYSECLSMCSSTNNVGNCLDGCTSSQCQTVSSNSLSTVSCGGKTSGGYLLENIPRQFPRVISIIYNFIQIAVPIVLIVLGMIDLMKGITAQKEDEITKSKNIFIKRIMAAVIIFFVLSIVKLIVSFFGDSDNKNLILDCVECLIYNNEKCE
jgi:hypothetical protein